MPPFGKILLHDESQILKARSDSRTRRQWLRQNAEAYRERWLQRKAKSSLEIYLGSYVSSDHWRYIANFKILWVCETSANSQWTLRSPSIISFAAGAQGACRWVGVLAPSEFPQRCLVEFRLSQADFERRVQQLEEKGFQLAALQHCDWWRKAQRAWRAATSFIIYIYIY